MSQKLSQVLAVEKSIKAAREKTITESYHTLKVRARFDGQQKTYEPFADDDVEGRQVPPEKVNVQEQVTSLLDTIRRSMIDVIDITATKDAANCNAVADVVVAGKVLAKSVPAVTLLYLEKALTDLRTELASVPELDPAEVWTMDDASGLFRTEPKKTVRTKKIAKVHTLVPPTDRHPGQAQLHHEDVSAGHWVLVKMSGAMRRTDKLRLISRVEDLQRAVKYAREEANTVDAESVRIGADLLGYVFADR